MDRDGEQHTVCLYTLCGNELIPLSCLSMITYDDYLCCAVCLIAVHLLFGNCFCLLVFVLTLAGTSHLRCETVYELQLLRLSISSCVSSEMSVHIDN